MPAEKRNFFQSLSLKVKDFLTCSTQPMGIDADVVFQSDYPPEAWEQTLASLTKDRRECLSELVTFILGKTPESRRNLIDGLCLPERINPFGTNSYKQFKKDQISRQVVIDMLATSENNLESMKIALEKITHKS